MARPSPRKELDIRLLETGNIIFFYRPRRGVLHPRSPDDLERAYFALFPDDQEHHQNRLFIVAHAVFPAIIPGAALPSERDWAFIADISREPREVIEALEKNVPAPSPPSGERVRPWARVAGEGRYALARHEDHTHLVYWLHQPEQPGEVQQVLQIHPEASYIIAVKQPFAPSEIQLKEKPGYPEELVRMFDGHGWIPVDPPDFLDYRWTQVLLIGAEPTVETELGIHLDPTVENAAAKKALDELRAEAREAHSRWHVELFEPMCAGRWE
ncbi:MAG: hypothetical protein IRY83_14960 [Chloroflexi bacterium]|nr:hypothetical protein [Chloroflexota bacterium]